MEIHPRFDQAMKRLLTIAHGAFLALILPNAVWRGALAAELPGGVRLADLLWEVVDEGTRIVLHLELQTYVDEQIGFRIAEYIVRIYDRYHLPVRSFVIYLRPANNIPAPPFVIGYGQHQSLICPYGIIRLWEIDPQLILNMPQPHVWPLAGLMAGTSSELVYAVAERIAAEPLARQDKSELIGILGLLAGLRIPKDAIAQALGRSHMIEDIWKESSFAEAIYDVARERGLADGRAEGLEQGLEQGREQGLSAGQLQAMRLLAHDAVAQRFPDVAPDIFAGIAALADQEVLRRLILHTAEISDSAALAAIIAAAAPPAQE